MAFHFQKYFFRYLKVKSAFMLLFAYPTFILKPFCVSFSLVQVSWILLTLLTRTHQSIPRLLIKVMASLSNLFFSRSALTPFPPSPSEVIPFQWCLPFLLLLLTFLSSLCGDFLPHLSFLPFFILYHSLVCCGRKLNLAKRHNHNNHLVCVSLFFFFFL